jgi:hypothetical protein
MPGEHLAGYLRVAWLIGPYQAEICEPKEKREGAKSKEQQPIGEGGPALSQGCRFGDVGDSFSSLLNFDQRLPVPSTIKSQQSSQGT